jgi:hypothetical protein
MRRPLGLVVGLVLIAMLGLSVWQLIDTPKEAPSSAKGEIAANPLPVDADSVHQTPESCR